MKQEKLTSNVQKWNDCSKIEKKKEIKGDISIYQEDLIQSKLGQGVNEGLLEDMELRLRQKHDVELFGRRGETSTSGKINDM